MSASGSIDQLTSEELAVSARTGSEECFSELVARHRGALFRLLCRRVPSREDAEDLTQEAFSRAHQKLELFDPAYKFETWLFTIGTRLSYSFYRRKKLDQVQLRETDRITEENPAGMVSLAEQCDDLWQAVADALPALQAEVMWYRYGKDMSIKETARKTGKSAVYVKVLLHRARKTLVERFNNKEQRL